MKCILIFVISVLFGSNIFAQPFSLDTTFNVNYTFNFGGIGGEIRGSNYEQDVK